MTPARRSEAGAVQRPAGVGGFDIIASIPRDAAASCDVRQRLFCLTRQQWSRELPGLCFTGSDPEIDNDTQTR
jgi:hypothetical protein